MHVEPRRILIGLIVLGVASAVLFLPAVFWVGTLLAPSFPVPVAAPVPPLLAEAIWARANGGRATTLQPLTPFSIGRTLTCHALAERFDTPVEREQQHDECMTLLPAIEGIGYLSNRHMQSVGVWQDPRVPLVSIATIARVSSSWTKTQVIETLAARGEFTKYLIGADPAARAMFGRPPAELSLPQAALMAAVLGNRAAEPWCDPVTAADMRRRILERMRGNQVIDDANVEAGNRAPLGLGTPPVSHPGCPP